MSPPTASDCRRLGCALRLTSARCSSLSALGNVIAALASHRSHIPYRDSKMTRLLQSSLGSNCLTTLIATISADSRRCAETLSTLGFASRTKQIRNIAAVNEDLDETGLLRKYEREIRTLREALAAGVLAIMTHRHSEAELPRLCQEFPVEESLETRR